MTIKHFFSAIIITFSITLTAQSPWVDEKGSIYASATATFITYSDIFDSNGEGLENGFETNDRTFSLYASYSITDRTAVIVDLPFKAVSANDNTLSNIGDFKFQVKHELFKSIPLTAFASYTAPTGTREGP